MLLRFNTQKKRALQIFDTGISARKFYLTDQDLPSFPNRIKVLVNRREVNALVDFIQCDRMQRPDEINAEIDALGSRLTWVIIPFSLGAQTTACFDTAGEAPYTTPLQPVPVIPPASSETRRMQLFIKGDQVPNVCVACRKAPAHGGICPDYDPMLHSGISLRCLSSDTVDDGGLGEIFYLNEKGDLAYGLLQSAAE